MKKLLLLGLLVLYLLHNDLWLWNDARLIFGIPAGMFYHILFCIAASVLMYLLTIFAWPDDLETQKREETP